jgi:hypothetical protein
MQENSRFFQFIWRVNALAIASIVIVAGVVGLYALYSFIKEETRDRLVTKTPTVKTEQPRQQEMRLGVPVPVSGTVFVRVPLHRAQKTNVTYYSKSIGASTVNELFVDNTNGQSAWLFKGVDRLIVNHSDILSQLKSAQPSVTSIVYTLVEKDTNGDERLSSNDKVSVGYSAPDGSAYTPLLDNVDKLFAIDQVADDRLIILYARQGESRLTTYALPNYAIVIDKELPKLPDEPPAGP